MAILWYVHILVAFVCFPLLYWRWNKHQVVINWPVLGMLPGLLQNAQHIHEFVTRILKHHGGTFEFKGPWFTNLNFVITGDPTNINHILCRNFSNYGKGPQFREIFEPLGDGILSSDSDSWKYQRKLLQSLMNNSKFELFLEKVSRVKVEKGLIPILDHFSSQGIEVDLQDIFQRYTFDSACSVVLGSAPNCLSIESPQVAPAKAFDQIEQGAFYRHIMPNSWWKLQRWLQIGEEKKLNDAWKMFDQFLYQCISSKREELMSRKMVDDEPNFDLLTAYIEKEEEDGFTKSDKFLRDTTFTLMAAGKETVSAGLTWFLWLVAKHPSVEAKIVEEIKEHLVDENDNENTHRRVFSIDELNKLVYLHAAILESLRLFPPIPFEHLYAVDSDILPSGQRVGPNTRMLYSLYSMGRMESIWGEDCLEFKPERWISEQGRIVHVPSYKFITFNAGPRACVGKQMTFIQMKMVSTAIIWNYQVHVVESHPVLPSISILLHMKHGLKVRISKRCI